MRDTRKWGVMDGEGREGDRVVVKRMLYRYQWLCCNRPMGGFPLVSSIE